MQKDLLDRRHQDLDIDQQGTSTYRLLIAMLEHAPAKSGKRYIATVLHITGTKGLDAVRKVAEAIHYSFILGTLFEIQ